MLTKNLLAYVTLILLTVVSWTAHASSDNPCPDGGKCRAPLASPYRYTWADDYAGNHSYPSLASAGAAAKSVWVPLAARDGCLLELSFSVSPPPEYGSDGAVTQPDGTYSTYHLGLLATYDPTSAGTSVLHDLPGDTCRNGTVGQVSDIGRLVVSRYINCPDQYNESTDFCYMIPSNYWHDRRKIDSCCDSLTQPSIKDPVGLALHNAWRTEKDVEVSPHLFFERRYNSDLIPSGVTNVMAGDAGSIGKNWSTNFDKSIQWTVSGPYPTAYASRPGGQVLAFMKQGESWIADADVSDHLQAAKNSAGEIVGWTFTDHSTGAVENYGPEGQLQSISYSDGGRLTLQYDGTFGLLVKVSDERARSLFFSYGQDITVSAGLIQSVADDAAHTWSYGYDSQKNLTSVTGPDGVANTYAYESGTSSTFGSASLLTTVGLTDAKGIHSDLIWFTYDHKATTDVNPVVETHEAGGANAATFVNTSTSSTVTEALGNGISRTQTFNFSLVSGAKKFIAKDGGCSQSHCGASSVTYDSNGLPAEIKDFRGSVKRLTYVDGLVSSEVDNAGGTSQRTIETTWDTTRRKPLSRTVKDASGLIAQREGWAYNSDGQTTATCLIDSSLAPNYVCSDVGVAPAGVRRTVTSYCTSVSSTCPLIGLVLATDGPRADVSDVKKYTWYQTTDESGCGASGGPCHRAGDLQVVTDGAGLTTTYVAYDKAGRIARIKRENGVLTDYTYTPRGWLASSTVRALASGTPSSQDATTTLSYTPYGSIEKVTDPDGVSSTYTYDAARRLTDITDGLGRRTHYTLDVAGNKTSEQVLSATGTVTKTITGTFNTLGQLTSITDGLGRTIFSATDATSYDANGNLSTSKDGLGIQQHKTFDALDRLVSTIQNYQGADTATKDTQSVTSFDAIDRVAGASDPEGLNTIYDHDAFGNVTGIHSPDTGATTNTFDVAGNLITSKDATGNNQAATYDENNRPLTRTFADTNLNVQYKYDEADSVTGCTGSFAKGRLTRVIEGSGGIVWCYDGRGNVIRKQQTVGTVTTTTSYTWTLGNRLKSITTANGTLVSYVRDTNGGITSVTATPRNGTATTVASQASYTPFGSIASVKLGDGQTATYSYDASGALTDIASTALTLHFKRDAMGDIVAIGNASGVATPSEIYSYDPLYRLTGLKSSSGTSLEAYTYNKTGDRITKSAPGILTGTYTYATGTHHLTGIGTTTRVVDARGNTTARVLSSGSYGYGYNQRNRLTVVQSGGATVGAYVFNALDQRVQKTSGGTVTRFDYSEDGRLLSESTGTKGRDYVWLDGIPVGVVDVGSSSSSVAMIHADALGAPRAVTNASGSVMWQWSYAGNPFGEKAPTSSSSYTLNLRFPGQYFDVESGILYNIHRDYEPASGRYLQSDPIGLDAGPSTYAYVGSNPLAAVDPLGLTKWEVGVFMGSGGRFGYEFGYGHFTARSECVNGTQGFASGNILFGGPSVGLPISFSGSSYTLDDNTPGNTDGSVFNGGFSYQGLGVAFGAGAGISKIRIGSALSSGYSPGSQGGFSEGASSDIGRSWVTTNKTNSCGCH